MNKIKNYKKIVVITLSFLLMFSLIVPSTQNLVFAEGQETPVEEKTEDSELTENVDNDKEGKEANDEEKQEEQTEEVEDATVEEDDENITNDIVEPSQSTGEHRNRSNIYDLPNLAPSLKAVNVGTYTPVVLLDAATGIRYSYARDGLIQYSIIERCKEEELRRNADGGITIPNVIGGYPVRGIRNYAFDLLQLRGKLIFRTVGPQYQMFIGNGAFSRNQITSVEGDVVKQRLFEARCAGSRIFQDNLISDISGFFNSQNESFQEYSIPGLTFEGNRIQNANFTTSKHINSIGAMAFANNQMLSISYINDNITIYSGAFFNNRLTTYYINRLPNTVIFSTSTNDVGPHFDVIPSFNRVETKELHANGEPSAYYEEGFGAFQKNLLTEVPTVKAGWKFGYRTFADNQITSIILNETLEKASKDSMGCFANNPLSKFLLSFSTFDLNRAIPKEFVAVKNNKGEYFRDTTTSESLTDVRLQIYSVPTYSGYLTIKEGAFRGTGIKEIYRSDDVKIIEKEAFAYCDNLTSITGSRNPDGSFITGLEYVYSIGEKAFFKCHNLAGTLTLSNRITIGEFAFAMTDSLTDNIDPSIERGKITKISLSSFGERVPTEFRLMDIGRGAFAYQSILQLPLETWTTEGAHLTAVHIREYAFAHNRVKELRTAYVSNTVNTSRMTHIYSKSFIGNQFTHYNPGIYGIGTIAQDAFSNQNIAGLTVRQELATKNHLLSLEGYWESTNGIGFLDRNKVSSASIFGGNAPMTGGSASVEGGNPLYIKWGSAKPTQVIMSYLIKDTNGNAYNGAVVDTKFDDLKYEYEIKYQIGNLNNDQAGFSPDMTQKFVQKYVKEDSGLVASATEGSTIHLNPGYMVAGWYDNPECTGTPVSNTVNPTEATTIYAKIVESIDLTLHSGTNAEFGSIGSGVREKILKVPEGSTVRETFDAMSEEERNQWNLAFDNTSQENSEMKRVGEWFTTNTFATAYYDGAPITNVYGMDAAVTDATPKNLYADVDKLTEITFHSVAPPNNTTGDFVYYSGEFESENSGIVSKTMTVRHGKVLKDIFESMPESERPKWEIKYNTSVYDKLLFLDSPWLTSNGTYTPFYVTSIDHSVPRDLHPMILKKIGSIRMHSGSFAEFGTIGSGIRELEFKIYEGMENVAITEIMLINIYANIVDEAHVDIAYDESKYRLEPAFYTNPQFTTAINGDAPYIDTYGYSDIYLRLTPLTIEDVIIPDPDNTDTPLWGVEVPREVVLEKDREMDVKTKLVSLTGYEESIDSNLNVDLYIRSQNGMRLKREDPSSTEKLKYRVLLGNASLGGTSSNQGTTDTLAGTFTSTNKTIQGTAKVLEDGLVMDHYKDNLIFKIQRRVMP